MFHITSLLSMTKGQMQYINLLKRHLIIIPSLARVFYNFINAKSYLINLTKA